MASDPEDNILRISKHLLLSSPPGQFDLILSDLRNILSGKTSEGSASLLDSAWIDQVRADFESRSGKCVLRTIKKTTDDLSDGDSSHDEGVKKLSSDSNNISKMEHFLEQKMRKYLETYYASKGVDSNIQITRTTANSSIDDGSSIFTILLYAERIQLPQYHAGSWLSRYNITISTDTQIVIDGSVILRAHTFEHGNVQMNSTTSLGPITIPNESLSTAANVIVEKIQSWEEDHVINPLHEAYDNLGSGILKKLRRVMPVTRTRFDWNMASHRLHKNIGIDIGQNK